MQGYDSKSKSDLFDRLASLWHCWCQVPLNIPMHLYLFAKLKWVIASLTQQAKTPICWISMAHSQTWTANTSRHEQVRCSGNEAKANILLVCICNISRSFLVMVNTDFSFTTVICTLNLHAPPIWLFHLTRGASPAAWHHGRRAGSSLSAKGSNMCWSTARSKLLSTHKFNTIIYLQGAGIKLLREPAVALHWAVNNGCRAPARSKWRKVANANRRLRAPRFSC